MIKKLRNQPYAPKVEQAPKWEQKRKKKKRKNIANEWYRYYVSYRALPHLSP
jgi:hypothetical protein